MLEAEPNLGQDNNLNLRRLMAKIDFFALRFTIAEIDWGFDYQIQTYFPVFRFGVTCKGSAK
jgi:hypothetical protein